MLTAPARADGAVDRLVEHTPCRYLGPETGLVWSKCHEFSGAILIRLLTTIYPPLFVVFFMLKLMVMVIIC